MTPFNFIIKFDDLLEMMRHPVTLYKLNILLHRKNKDSSLSYILCKDIADARSTYHNGEYLNALFTTKAIPKENETTNAFWERSAKEAIEVRGILSDDKNMEMSTIRIVSKESPSKKILDAMKKIIKEGSDGAGVYINGHFYKDVLYANNVWEYTVWNNLPKRLHLITRNAPVAGPVK